MRSTNSSSPHRSRFVFYGDACSGVPGASNAQNFASVNAVVADIQPEPEFVIFAGDEVMGLTRDEASLRAQWHYWFEHELAWLDRDRIPVFHCTSNHTTYDAMSEQVFREVTRGPEQMLLDRDGLGYCVRRGPLLLVFVDTCHRGLGGEGRVDCAWLDRVLAAHADATMKLVIGHHPCFPVNGYSGPYQRELGGLCAATFWHTLCAHGVTAYLCSHLLAFDVQVHSGVLQIVAAGAGTGHRMPPEYEYLHALACEIDMAGFRYQVLDVSGSIREQLHWPAPEPGDGGDAAATWRTMSLGAQAMPRLSRSSDAGELCLLWRCRGKAAPFEAAVGAAQTWVALFDESPALPLLWLGVTGPEQQLTLTMAPLPGRSPMYWFGPSLSCLAADEPDVFAVEVMCHGHMGPGGVMWRRPGGDWSSLAGIAPWGLERMPWPESLSVGCGPGGPKDARFRGTALRVETAVLPLLQAW